MIARVNPPEEDSYKLVVEILKERVWHKDFYSRISADLLKKIEQYIEHKGNPEKILSLDLRPYVDSDADVEARKQSLIGLYKPTEGKLPFAQLEKLRKENGLLTCPSCGEPGRPRTLDHYLPKDIFPEYAFTLLNLTPMCDWCQGEKSIKYLTDQGKKKYIHPYFDDVHKPLFSITFSPPYISPVIGIKVRDDLPDELQSLVASHLEGVDFLRRFKEFFKTSYINILRKSKRCRESKRLNLSEHFNLFLEAEMDKSINSWDAILYRSIIEDCKLMKYLEEDTLPENL